MIRLAFTAALVLTASGALAQTERAPLETLRDRLGYRTAQAFDCSNVSCSRLRSCAEACYKLQQCGQRVRDGDNDGIPCENLCSSRC